VITAAEAILAAERPVFYVGGGAVSANVDPAELIRIAEAVQLPVVTTLMAKGVFPDSHPLCIGLPGMHGSKAANWAMNRADLLIACGARFDDRVTGKLDAFAPDAKVIHMDVDPAEIDKNRSAQIPIVGSLELVVPKLAEALQSRMNGGPPKAAEWLRTVQAWKQEHPFRYRNTEPLKPEFVIERLRDLTADREVIWTTGVGQHQMWAAQYLQIDRPRHWLTSGGLGTMGFGVPAAIGAKAARPDATVVCVDGDGCFQMTSQELATSVLEELPIVVVVVNNGYLGMVRQWQDMFFEERFSQIHLTHAVPDYAALARAYGGVGLTVENEDELEGALAEALACGRTAVVDCRVDPREHCFPMIPAGAAALDVVEYNPESDAEALTL